MFVIIFYFYLFSDILRNFNHMNIQRPPLGLIPLFRTYESNCCSSTLHYSSQNHLLWQFLSVPILPFKTDIVSSKTVSSNVISQHKCVSSVVSSQFQLFIHCHPQLKYQILLLELPCSFVRPSVGDKISAASYTHAA